MANGLAQGIRKAAFAFRGYNISNLGRTPELLAHPVYGPVVERFLDEGSELYAEVFGRKVNFAERLVSSMWPRWLRRGNGDATQAHSGEAADSKQTAAAGDGDAVPRGVVEVAVAETLRPGLSASPRLAAATRRLAGQLDLAERARRREESTLETYPQDLVTVVAVELAQLKLLDEFFGVRFDQAQFCCGYSLGEVSAVIATGLYDMESVLLPILRLARDAVDLGRDTKMGVLFSRGPALDMDAVYRHCLRITNEGHGVVAISTYLSPNSVLLMGQGKTVERFGETMHDVLSKPTHLKVNPHRWPPMHTPITWQRNIPNRAGVMLGPARGGFTRPTIPILSCITGDFSYDESNSRELLIRWVDHPQLLWDVVDKTLAAGVETVIHVGPEPNLLPATFRRLSNNVATQLARNSIGSFGRRAISRMVRRHRPWLKLLLSSDATLLRAPYVEHVILEDWLLEQPVA